MIGYQLKFFLNNTPIKLTERLKLVEGFLRDFSEKYSFGNVRSKGKNYKVGSEELSKYLLKSYKSQVNYKRSDKIIDVTDDFIDIVSSDIRFYIEGQFELYICIGGFGATFSMENINSRYNKEELFVDCVNLLNPLWGVVSDLKLLFKNVDIGSKEYFYGWLNYFATVLGYDHGPLLQGYEVVNVPSLGFYVKLFENEPDMDDPAIIDKILKFRQLCVLNGIVKDLGN